jgi:putative ABC transport system permease protein
MVLLSYFTVNDAVADSIKLLNRIVTMSSQGLAQPVPIARVREIAALEGVKAATPFSWYGGKFNEEVMPFAQFGVDPSTIWEVYDELSVPEEQKKAFVEKRDGAVIGRRLAQDRNLKVGDPLPLKQDLYPVDMNLTVVGIYDGTPDRDLRMCFFNWDFLNEELKSRANGQMADNAGVVIAKVASADLMPTLSKAIDASYANSDTPTRTQTEEAFVKMFSEMFGDLKGMIRWISLAVLVSLLFVAGNAMAMAMRERTTEMAVLKAIGFRRGLVMTLVLAEAVLVAGLGGAIGTLGAKVFFDLVDLGKYTAGMLPFFFVPWSTALIGLGASLFIGFASGVLPAIQSARLSVIDGLRKVV